MVNLEGLTFLAQEGAASENLPFQPSLSNMGRAYKQSSDIAWGYGEVAFGIPWKGELFVVGVPFLNMGLDEVKKAMENTLTLNIWAFDHHHALILNKCGEGGPLKDVLSSWLHFICANTGIRTFCHLGRHEGEVLKNVARDCGLSIKTEMIPSRGPSWTMCEKFETICTLHSSPTRFMREKGLSPVMHCPLAAITAFHSKDLTCAC